ncbi:MAG: hypothetical protein KKB13_12700, partial [Chloroflexi bacterium]|nr:hypothetical protein [Chloroflexota bacterium]
VMITGEAPIPADTTFRLQIELTDDVADQPHLEVQARSLWSEPDIVPRFYTTGFELVTVQMGSTK